MHFLAGSRQKNMFFLPWFPKEQLGNLTFLEPKSLSKKRRGEYMFVYVCLGKILGDYYRTFSKGWPVWFGSLLFTKKKRIDRSGYGIGTLDQLFQKTKEPVLIQSCTCCKNWKNPYKNLPWTVISLPLIAGNPLVLWDFSKTLDWRRLSFSNSLKKTPRNQGFYLWFLVFFFGWKFLENWNH